MEFCQKQYTNLPTPPLLEMKVYKKVDCFAWEKIFFRKKKD